jgi:ubiquitin C-terminal hydrolase
MDSQCRSLIPLGDEGLRSRKRMNEGDFNEEFEAELIYIQSDDIDNLTIWHKFLLSDLFEGKCYTPCNKDLSHDYISENAQEQLIEDYSCVKKIFDITEEICLEVLLKPGPIIDQTEKRFKLSVYVKAFCKDKKDISNYEGCEILLFSKISLKSSRDVISKRKMKVTVQSSTPSCIEVYNDLFYSDIDECIHEIQVNLARILDIKSQESPVLSGLVNLGVTCYMNSYLQAIFHLKKFRFYINRLDNENNQNTFVFSLQRLFYMMEKSQGESANPNQLVKSFGWNIQQIFTQQDVQEFSFMFLDAIEAKSKSSGIKELINTELFQGRLESFIRCKNIDFESSREEVFTDIQLAIKNSSSLSQALDNYLCVEELSGENAYETENEGKQEAIKGVRFKQLPKVLIFHLGRFEYNFETDRNTKLLNKFTFPEQIDMNKYIGMVPPEQLKRKSSISSDINDIVRGTSNSQPCVINKESRRKLSQEIFQKHSSQIAKSDYNQKDENNQSSKEIYVLFGVFVHFGFNSNSGHYEVYLKINNQWYEFNDESVRKVDFQEVKRQGFGGEEKISYMDNYRFKLNEKTHNKDGHAYMLIYVRADDYNDIVHNKNEIFEYPLNVKESAKADLKYLQKENLRKTHYKVYLLSRETFVGKPTGRGCLFFTTCHNDHLQRVRFKESKQFLKIYIINTVTSSELTDQIKSQYPHSSNDMYYLFIYNEKRDDFYYMNPDLQYPEFDYHYVQYIYIHWERLPIEGPIIPNPSLLIIKKWENDLDCFYVKNIKLNTQEDTMNSIEQQIEEEEKEQIRIYYESFNGRKLENFQEPICSEPLVNLLRSKGQSSINFVYGLNEDDIKVKMVQNFQKYKNLTEIQLLNQKEQLHYYFNIANNTCCSELFLYIRIKLGIVENKDFEMNLHFQTSYNNWISVNEFERDFSILALLKSYEVHFEIKSRIADSELIEVEEFNVIPVFYLSFANAKIPMTDCIDFFKYQETNPTAAELFDEVSNNDKIKNVIKLDFDEFCFNKNLDLGLNSLSIYTLIGEKFKEVLGMNLYNNAEYFIIPVIEILDTKLGNPVSKKKEDFASLHIRGEIQVVTNMKRVLTTPILFLIPKLMLISDFLKLIEIFIQSFSINNPDSNEIFQTEYIKRNLRIVLNDIDERETELEKVGSSLVQDLGGDSLCLSAIISIHSFRNNIKINI